MSDPGYSTVGNTEVWTVTFVDDNDVPTAPDADTEVVWEVLNYKGFPFAGAGETQDAAEAVGNGGATFEFRLTPTYAMFESRRTLQVKATAVIQGDSQSFPAERRNVKR